MKDRILAFDLGTGGVKATLFDDQGAPRADEFVSYETTYPDSGWHEQRPDDWWDAVVRSAGRLLAGQPKEGNRVACVALSGQSLGVIPVDGQGRLLRDRTPIWSDTRAGAQTASFFGRVDPEKWYLTTGNGFPAECYALFKAMWYRDNEPEMFREVRWLLGSKDYVNYRMTGRAVTDPSYASGSGAFNLTEWRYEDAYIEAAGLDRSMFPDVVPSTEVIGEITTNAAATLGLPAGIPVVAGGVDNSCMALGARNIAEGRVYTSLGSSAWIAVSSRRPVVDVEKKPFVFAHVIPQMFTSAVSIFAAGTSLQWVRDVLFTAKSGEGATYREMDTWAEESPIGANGLLFNPSLAGGTSQEPSPRIRGGFYGLDLRHRRGDVVRSVLEGVALNLGTVLDLLRGFVDLEEEMLLVGGGSRSVIWRQIFADVYGMRVVKTNVDQDAGSLGAAALGAVGVGIWDGFERIDAVHRTEAVATPGDEARTKYEAIGPLFERARRDAAALGEMLHAAAEEA